MSEQAASGEVWRIDPAGKDSSAIRQTISGDRRLSPRERDAWKSRAMRWARKRAERLARSVLMPEEGLVHSFALRVEEAEDTRTIEDALTQCVRDITKAPVIEWIAAVEGESFKDPAPRINDSGDGEWKPPVDVHDRVYTVRSGRKTYGHVRLGSGGRPWSPATEARLHTLLVLAAAALAGRELGRGDGGRSEALAPESGVNTLDGRPEPRTDAVSLGEYSSQAPVLHDATFLHAVLPFAASQARRHHECLALLCVAVDRLNGIRDLLGRDRATQALRNVGNRIVRMLRTSDIVALLDDDRILAVLPKAPLNDARRVAENICRAIEQESTLLPELPSLTVSIGVAELPDCGGTVYTLLDAADHALTQAQVQGRNRAVAFDAGATPAPGIEFQFPCAAPAGR